MRRLSGAVLFLCVNAWSADDALVSRGKYVFTLADCGGCHSERDFSKYSAPVLPGALGKGFVFPAELGLPGKIVAPNLTPDPETGLGSWTNEQIIQAIRNGLAKDGKVLFAFMPYNEYRNMSDGDVQALVAYIKTLAPVKNPLPRTELPPGMPAAQAPPPVTTVPAPDRANKVKYGEYLVTIGNCAHCHTAMGPQGPDKSKLFAGGAEFKFPGGFVVRSANITPDVETGIGRWTEKGFIARFHLNRRMAQAGAPPATPANFTIMPWIELSQLTEEDLGAMYAYLKTLPPVRNKVLIRPAAGR